MGQIPGQGGVPASPEDLYMGADCIQLVHFDGGSTAATVGVGVSANSGGGSESVPATSPKFGDTCLQITSTSGYYRYNAQAQWSIPNGTDFTHDIWAYPTAAPGAGVERSVWSYDSSTPGGAGRLYIAQFGATGLRFHVNGTNYDFTGAGFALNTWAHLAMTRAGTTCYFFKDGVLLGTRTSDTTAFSAAGSNPKYGDGFIGRFDEYHFQKGTARWTGNFVPNTGPYRTTP